MTHEQTNKQLKNQTYHIQHAHYGQEILEPLRGTPLELCPAMGCELSYRPLEFAAITRDLFDASPRIVLDFKVLARLHPEIRSQPIAQKNIQDPLMVGIDGC